MIPKKKETKKPTIVSPRKKKEKKNMATPEVKKLVDLEGTGQSFYRIQDIALNDTSQELQLNGPVSAIRFFAFAAGNFTVVMDASPNGKTNRFLPVQTITQAAPSGVVPGPIGCSIRFRATAAANPVDLFIVAQEIK